MEPKSTITQLKRLIGKKWSDPELQADLPTLNYNVEEGPNNTPVVRVNVLGEQRLLRPEQLLAALLSELRNIAEKDQGAKVTDCVIAVPMFFTEAQRRAVLDSAAIIGMNVLRLIHETTATALAFGIYKQDLPADKPLHVAFVDAGHSSLQARLPARFPPFLGGATPANEAGRSISMCSAPPSSCLCDAWAGFDRRLHQGWPEGLGRWLRPQLWRPQLRRGKRITCRRSLSLLPEPPRLALKLRLAAA